MKATFNLYNGLAGDPHLLLTMTDEEGYKVSRLYNRNSLFPYWSLKRAKNKLIKQHELLNGTKIVE